MPTKKPLVLLLDIEGTTTPISFVVDVLFPYVRDHLQPFVTTTWDDDDLRAVYRTIAEEEARDLTIEGVVGAVRAQMDVDKKSTALKALQGTMWRTGYEHGQLKGVVFGDVPEVLRAANAHSVRVCIYSSGSIAAQRLLFGHSDAGDLTPLLSGYFDTTTGPKREAASYRAIAAALEVDPADILFCTDIVAEAVAARTAGVSAVLLDRPGNGELGEHDFEVWTSLRPLLGVL